MLTCPGRKKAGVNNRLLALLCLLLSGDIHPCTGPGVVSIDLNAGGPAAELHTPSVGFRRGWLAEQLAPPAGLCGLALTAADLAAGPLPTPSEDYWSAPRAGGRAAEIHTPPAGFRGGRIASTPSENCGSAPRASGLAAEILAPPDTTGHHRTPPDWLQKRPAS
ncbi:hypothetical protein NQZ68_013904 [Dissostichus eleginoides]|nr:hypothetical protein NQZ68_013904 [Dissostichus eleginoides]